MTDSADLHPVLPEQREGPEPLTAEEEERLRVEFFGLNREAEHVADAYIAGMAYGRTIARTRKIALALTWFCAGILAATVVVGFARAATPRTSVQPVTLYAASGASAGAPTVASDFAQIPAPSATLGAAMSSSAGPTAGATEPAAVAGGLASYVSRSYGPRYLALPDGPGLRVVICSARACVTRTSTDAGPDLAMQRAGRIADVSWWDFRTLCGCHPETVGLVQVTISDAPSLTPPPTSTQP